MKTCADSRSAATRYDAAALLHGTECGEDDAGAASVERLLSVPSVTAQSFDWGRVGQGPLGRPPETGRVGVGGAGGRVRRLSRSSRSRCPAAPWPTCVPASVRDARVRLEVHLCDAAPDHVAPARRDGEASARVLNGASAAHGKGVLLALCPRRASFSRRREEDRAVHPAAGRVVLPLPQRQQGLDVDLHGGPPGCPDAAADQGSQAADCASAWIRGWGGLVRR